MRVERDERMERKWNRIKWNEKREMKDGNGIEGRHLKEAQLHELIGTRETTFLSCVRTKR